jgi:cytochrome c peroxidase
MARSDITPRSQFGASSSPQLPRAERPGSIVGRLRRLVAGLALSCAVTGVMADSLVPGRAEFDVCQACHGVSGQGTRDLGAPRIAGLDASYVERQLREFRSGTRGADPADVPGGQMRSMAATLADDTAVGRVAQYVAEMVTRPTPATVNGEVKAGQALYGTCIPCHGALGQGSPSVAAPRLAGMSDWYLLRQLEAYRAGRRGGGDSGPAATMKAIAASLPSEAALLNVVAYINTLNPPTARQESASSDSLFALSDACPPSFDETGDGRCRFVSLYDLYTADPGNGGLRVPLPPLHDGFTPQQADLGRYLFFDPLLSGDRDLSCAQCHHPDLGFADARPTSRGRGGHGLGPQRRGGVPLRRGAPTLWNVGFLARLFWDGRATTLEDQATGPLFAPDEMANTPEGLVWSLTTNGTYRSLFAVAFGRDEAEPITVQEVTAALAAFESALVSINSRYDRYAHGDPAALTEQELRGYNVFRGFVARCSQCHVPPLFASSDVAVVGAPPVAGKPYDLGAAEIRDDRTLRGAFKVPTLRNIARTAPYFQAGQFSTLEDVVDFYNAKRGHAAPHDADLEIHWHVHMDHGELTRDNVVDLVAFLKALSDESLRPATPRVVPSGLPVVESAINLTARNP